MFVIDRELLVTNIKARCEANRVKPTNACRDCGVGASFISDIIRGQTPSVAKVQQLAQFLGCTVSDLLGEGPPDKAKPIPGDGDGLELQLSEEESRFLMVFRQIERKDLALSYLQALADSQKPPASNDSPESDTAPAPEAPHRKN